MGILNRFKSVPAEQRYSEIIKNVKQNLKIWNADFPLTEFIWNAGLLKEVNKISAKNVDYYARSRFLGGVFSAIWAIQRKGFWTSAVVQDKLWRATLEKDKNAIRKEGQPKNILNKVLTSDDSELKSELIKSISSAAAMLIKEDHDVDMKVACDLGKSKGYPERPPLPSGKNVKEDEIFGGAGFRVKLFWQHITGFPIPDILNLFFASCEKKRSSK